MMQTRVMVMYHVIWLHQQTDASDGTHMSSHKCDVADETSMQSDKFCIHADSEDNAIEV